MRHSLLDTAAAGRFIAGPVSAKAISSEVDTMFRFFVSLSIPAAFLSLAISAVAARADDANASWVGKTIIVKKDGIKIGYTEANGRRVDVATLREKDYTVLKDESGWIVVRDRGGDGWLDKADAVLLDEAPAFFTEKIPPIPRTTLPLRVAVLHGDSKVTSRMP